MKARRPGEPQRVEVGVAWYSEDQWARVKARATDPELFEASYSEWLEMAEGSLKLIQRSAGRVSKVYVDADELSAWCQVQGRKIDASARAAFASYKLSRSGGAA